MLSRHDLVWLFPAAWQAALRQAPPDSRLMLEKWCVEDWPAIVRRADDLATAQDVCIGIAVPPDPLTGAKRRIPLVVAQSAIRRWRHPLHIASVLDTVPQRWRAALAAMAREAARQQLAFHVFGSVALQTITGQDYLTPQSDIDLLLVPRSDTELEAGIALVSSFASQLPLDGEIVFPSGQAVAWKEWLNAGHGSVRLLAKGRRSVSLEARESLLKQWADKP